MTCAWKSNKYLLGRNMIVKTVRMFLGIGAVAVGVFALLYFKRKNETSAVQPVVSQEKAPVKDPILPEEDKTILEETFRGIEVAEVTEKEAQERQGTDPVGRRIGQYDNEMNLIAEYDSATVAARAVGSNRTSIRNCANGKQKHAGGFIWRYLDQKTEQEGFSADDQKRRAQLPNEG